MTQKALLNVPPTLWLQIPLCLHPFTLPIPYRFATGTDCSRHLCLIHTSHMAPTHILTLIIFKLPSVQFSSVQSLMSDSLRPHRLQHARLPCPSPTPRVYPLMSTESMTPCNYLILCRPLLLLPSIFPSIRVFYNESALHIRWPKYWSFSFSSSPSNEFSGQISFRIDWLDLLTVQGTLKSLLQHHSSKASILRGSAFFIVQLSHPYMTTGKTIALTRWTFIGKIMSLLFSMLSRLVIDFL